MSEDAWFYDYYPGDDDDPDIADVSRIYCFDEWAWTKEHTRQIHRIFKELPGYQNSNPYPIVFWFGTDEDDFPYLCASWEPPGLMITGFLARKDWDAWHQAFWEKIQDFPFREQW